MPFVVCCALVYFWTLRFSRIGDFYTLRLGFFGNLDLRIIHTIFPHELKDASIKYLAKNLRTRGVCKIALDIPKTGNYHFKCMKNAPESDLDSTN